MSDFNLKNCMLERMAFKHEGHKDLFVCMRSDPCSMRLYFSRGQVTTFFCRQPFLENGVTTSDRKTSAK